MLHSYLSSVQFICNLRFMFRIGSIDYMVNPSQIASDPRIDKPWGDTLREKLPQSVCLRYVNWRFKKRQQAFLAPLPGIGNMNPRAIYLVFGLTLIFIIAYTLIFLFVSLKACGKS